MCVLLFYVFLYSDFAGDGFFNEHKDIEVSVKKCVLLARRTFSNECEYICGELGTSAL